MLIYIHVCVHVGSGISGEAPFTDPGRCGGGAGCSKPFLNCTWSTNNGNREPPNVDCNLSLGTVCIYIYRYSYIYIYKFMQSIHLFTYMYTFCFIQISVKTKTTETT